LDEKLILWIKGGGLSTSDYRRALDGYIVLAETILGIDPRYGLHVAEKIGNSKVIGIVAEINYETGPEFTREVYGRLKGGAHFGAYVLDRLANNEPFILGDDIIARQQSNYRILE
jgi:hypothetical protein